MPLLSKILLWPLSVLYGAITDLRNNLYDRKALKSVRFQAPLISVGNLSSGGTGKTPHIEYLIRLLSPDFRVATLSRGYGRKTSGFQLASNQSTAADLGDEPFLFHAKYPGVAVSVAEDRVVGIPRLLDQRPETDVILLDDAFQHRAVRPGLSILLTEYDQLYTRDAMLPLGWLREKSSNAKRADIIVVTKCEQTISLEEKNRIRAELQPLNYQHLYFSFLKYGNLYQLFRRPDEIQDLPDFKNASALFVTGIAKNEKPLKQLRSMLKEVHPMAYRDHHAFDSYDLESIREAFQHLPGELKILVTTEKDAARFWIHRQWFEQQQLQLYVLPVFVEFMADDAENFNADIRKYVTHTLARWQQD